MPCRHVKMYLLVFCCFLLGTWIGSYVRDKHITLIEDCKFRPSTIKRFQKSATRQADQLEAKQNVFFLKTHKTAGTVVQNVVLRFADHHELFVGLPAFDDHMFRYRQGYAFHHRFMRQTTHKINILCHHMRFNYGEVRTVMPNNTVFFTIIREPTSLFESNFDYFHWDCGSFARVPHNATGLHDWVNNPDKYFKGKDDGRYWWFAKNGMSYDLGLDNLSEDENYIKRSIEKVDKIFSLILISDYLEESLILLRDVLHWNLEDMAFLKLNSRSNKTDIGDDLRKKILKWNKADAMLFEHFNQTFWIKVQNYGTKRMEQEVRKLKELNNQLKHACVAGGKPVVSSKVKDLKLRVYNPKGVSMTAYNLRPEAKFNRTCRDLVKPEVQWLHYLVAKQYGSP